METDRIRVLLIEDSPDDARLIQCYLGQAEHIHIEVKHADRLAHGLACLDQNESDVVLLDLGLPDSQGLASLSAVQQHSPPVPIVVLTGLDSDELAIEAVRAGAEDYLPKNGLDWRLLVRTLRYAIERVARRHAEQSLDDTTEALRQEQQILRELLELQERERKLVAYEIHDGFAQHSAGAMMSFQAFQQLWDQDRDQARRVFEGGLQMLGDSIAEARRLIGGLRPPVLDEDGIVAAIEYLISEAERHEGPEVRFCHDVSFDRLAPPLESALFRIVQEALTNACGHSQSRRVRVTLSQRGDRVLVEVQDWGIGFDPAQIQGEHFGLRGIRERAALLGGRAAIDTTPGQGTRILVELPLVEASQERSADTRR